MKNKKGFTLVELLVVIVVLGLLIMLTMTTVLNTMESSSRNVFASQVLKFADTAKSTFEQVKMEKGAATPTCYNIAGLKAGSSYGGTISIDYATGQVSDIRVYDKEFVYNGNFTSLAQNKGKATQLTKPANAAAMTAATNGTAIPLTGCVTPASELGS